MQKASFYIVLFLFIGNVYAQRTVRIAYVDMEYILENVEEYREANEQLDARVLKWKADMVEKQSIIDQMKKGLDSEKVLLTQELIDEREEEIALLEQELSKYQQDRFGPRGDLAMQKQRLVQPIQDQVFAEVQKIGDNKKYDFIFDKSADVVMLYSQNRFDISDQVLRAISRTRRVSAPKEDNSLDQFEEEPEEEISEALLERQAKAAQADAERAKTADEKRAEQLRIREERKKAYEARRKQLLEEREARRKAKLEERNKGKEEKEQEEEKENTEEQK